MDVISFTSDMFGLVLIVFCLILAGFFSCAETAVTSLDPLKVKHILASRGRKARHLQLWADYPERVLATVLIYNNVVNIFASSIATTMALRHFENKAVGIATVIMTLLVLVFGEIIPKSFAKTHAEPVAMITMRIISVVYLISSPVVRIFSGLAHWVVRLFSRQDIKQNDLTEEQLEFMVNEGHRTGVIKDMKRDIIEGAFEFDATRVKEILTPRTLLKCLPENATYAEAIALSVDSGHSRIPIFRDKLDQIVGIILIKDLIATPDQRVEKSQLKVKDVMRPAFFAPESKTIMRLFVDLKRTKNHMAIIIDEYGGTAGIVTMEDILEEIVGEIQDEHDEEDPDFLKVEDHIYEVDGAVDLEDFQEFFKIEPFEHDADTLGGWIIDRYGEMPKIGQTVEFDDLKMRITDVEQHRIKRVRVKKTQPKEV